MNKKMTKKKNKIKKKTKRNIPKDNSCLFASILFCFNKMTLQNVKNLRERVAVYVQSHSEEMKKVIPENTYKYAQKIVSDKFWGGSVEISVISILSETEIMVFDDKTHCEHLFGEGKGYKTRIYIKYNGSNHYDALYLKPFSKNKNCVAKFDSSNGYAAQKMRNVFTLQNKNSHRERSCMII